MGSDSERFENFVWNGKKMNRCRLIWMDEWQEKVASNFLGRFITFLPEEITDNRFLKTTQITFLIWTGSKDITDVTVSSCIVLR